MGLKEYKKKRNFESTTEPIGGKIKANKKLRFVVQFHQSRRAHYDFRLEWRGVLISFAVPKGLSFNPKDKRLAVKVEDHPLEYANFEGVIPDGNYGAGTVEIFDKGTYEPSFDMDKGLGKGHLKFVLKGKRFKGEWSLVKISDENWLLIKSEDRFAREEKEDFSLPFSNCKIELATLSSFVPSGKEWLFEIKYDGYRLISYFENGKARCLTRNGIDYTAKFDEIAKSIEKIRAKSFVIDGEVVAFDERGRSDFGLLQEKIKSGGELYYCIFDLLALDGDDLRNLPLIKRKEKLKRLLAGSEKNLIYCDHLKGDGEKCFEFAKKCGLEGIIAKKVNSPYVEKRTEDWLKIKCYLRQEFVICGFTTTEKNLELSALILGFFDGDKLIFVGKVGTGFDEKERLELSEKLNELKASKTPIDIFPNDEKVEAIWCKPKLVAEIQYAELTKDGLLRQPSFVGLREDKSPKEVVLEEFNGDKGARDNYHKSGKNCISKSKNN